jgi:hypothetical protein
MRPLVGHYLLSYFSSPYQQKYFLLDYIPFLKMKGIEASGPPVCIDILIGQAAVIDTQHAIVLDCGSASSERKI